jgi:hypothetical protein
VALKDYRREPRLSRLRCDETGDVIYRDEPEWRADIVRLRGPMPSDRGLPDRSGVAPLAAGRPTPVDHAMLALPI